LSVHGRQGREEVIEGAPGGLCLAHSITPRCLVLLAAAGLISGCEPDGERGDGAASRRPNIVLVTFESLRADHVRCYGYERDTTPAIDALAAEGIVFDRAYAVTSWTLTSHASMFTGLYPTAHRVIGPRDKLDDSYTTLAELLTQAGYQTAGLVAGPYLRTNFNLNQGFGYYDQSAANPKGNNAAWSDITNPHMEAGLRRFLREQRRAEQPFFLFLYLWDPHYDYIPPEPFDTKFVPSHAEPVDLDEYELKGAVTKDISDNQLAYVLSQYDGEILCTDALLGRLWDLLEDLGVWRDTAVIVAGDHGEEFFEHGTKGHKNNLYVESLHVPLIVKPPGNPVRRRDGRTATLLDVFPTVLELAGITAEGAYHGRSLLQPPSREEEPIFFELETSNYFIRPKTGKKYKKSVTWYAVQEGDYKLITVQGSDVWELYNVAEDPGERRPLASPTHEAIVARLRTELATQRIRMERAAAGQGRAGQADLTPEDLERLKSLGYIKTSEEGDGNP